MPTEPNDGGPAFPFTPKSYRRYAAVKMLSAMLSSPPIDRRGMPTREDCACEAWRWADALLATEHPQPPAQQPETAPDATIPAPANETTNETEGEHVGD